MVARSYMKGELELWEADFYLDGLRVRKRGFPTKREAKEYETIIIADHRRGVLSLPTSKSITFGEARQKYWDLYAVPSGQESDKYYLDFFEEKIGKNTPLSSFNREAARKLYSELLQSGWELSTVIRRWNLLHSIFREMVNLSYIKENPCSGIIPKKARKKAENPRQRWFTDEEMETIYSQCSHGVESASKFNSHFYSQEEREENMLFAVIARNTGFRENNLTYLRKRDVDFGSDLVWARDTKNGEDYSVPMTPACREALKRLFELRKDDLEFVFRRANWGKVFRRVFRALGWNKQEWDDEKNAVLHSFRHTYCSHLVMQGYNERTVMELMGWKTSAQFKTYAHLAPSFKKAAIATISNGPKAWQGARAIIESLPVKEN